MFEVSFDDVKAEGGFTEVSEFEFSLNTRKNGSFFDETATDKIIFKK